MFKTLKLAFRKEELNFLYGFYNHVLHLCFLLAQIFAYHFLFIFPSCYSNIYLLKNVNEKFNFDTIHYTLYRRMDDIVFCHCLYVDIICKNGCVNFTLCCPNLVFYFIMNTKYFHNVIPLLYIFICFIQMYILVVSHLNIAGKHKRILSYLYTQLQHYMRSMLNY